MRRRFTAAVLLWGVYALPLFVPPQARLAPPPLDPSLLERLFPGVPGCWVALRLTCLFAAVWLLTALRGDPAGAGTRSPCNPHDVDATSPRALQAACAVAALQACAGLWAAHFNRPLQLLYIAAFAAPTLILIGDRRRRRVSRHWRRGDWASAAGVGAVLAVWLPVGGLSAWRSPWVANGVDARMTFSDLASTMAPGFNLLTSEVRPGLTALHLVLQGAGILGPGGIPLTPQWVQADNILWLMVTAAGVALLATRIAGRASAPIAAAVFLFSPYVLMMPLFLAAFFFGPLMTVALLLLAAAVERRGSVIALAALGAVAGIAATHPALALVSAAVCVHVTWTLGLRPWLRPATVGPPRLPTLALAVALCSFAAAVLPALPSLRALPYAVRNYSSSRQQWIGMEVAAFGQVPPRLSEFHIMSGRSGPFDVTLGALLAPVAIPRTGLRMLGDALFEPLGIGLALAGVVLGWRRGRWAPALVALLLVTLLPGFVSSYDRPSITRMSVLPVPIALLAAVGCERLRRIVAPHLRPRVAVAVMTAAIITAGTFLSKVATPRVIPRSAVGIVLDALDGEAATHAALVVPGSWDPMEPDLFATQVPTHPLPLLPYTDRNALVRSGGEAAAELFLWSPGYEEQAAVSRAICERWPGAALYTLFDQAHLSRAFAARPSGPGWRPTLAPTQWRRSGCDQPLETEGSRAAAALAAAGGLVRQGRRHEAVQVLRAAARHSFVQAQLFDTLAGLLLEDSPPPPDVAEAVEWATRACQSVKFMEAAPLATLAAGYAAQQRFGDAARLAVQARRAAQAQGDEALSGVLEERLADYERRGRTVER